MSPMLAGASALGHLVLGRLACARARALLWRSGGEMRLLARVDAHVEDLRNLGHGLTSWMRETFAARRRSGPLWQGRAFGRGAERRAAASPRCRVVVVGGGFGGLEAARRLGRAPVEVTLVDRRNHHLFQPLLYQVATGGLSPADVSAPLRHLLARQRNTRVIMGEVAGVEPASREVVLRDGERVPYDTLIVAAGAQPTYFGRDDWAVHAPGLKDLEEARRVRTLVLSAFERAERERDEDARNELLTFVVVGGGPTGVELAGAVAELARDTLRGDFRTIDPGRARILLLEGGPRVLSAFPPALSARARKALERLGVAVRTGAMVTEIGPWGARYRRGGEETEVRARTVLWAAGVRGCDLGRVLADRLGAELDRAGRVAVAGDLSVPGHPEVLVIGDLARVEGEDGEPLPGLAPVAMQEGRYAAEVVRRRLRGERVEPFRYRDRGMLATIGRNAAVARLGPLSIGGRVAWWLWLFVHLLYLVDFANRVLVLVQWGWNYVTRNRTARIIPEPAAPVPAEPGARPRGGAPEDARGAHARVED